MKLLLITLFSCWLMTGCLDVPAQQILTTSNGMRIVDQCPIKIPSVRQQPQGLASTFRVTSWNDFKLQRPNWKQELSHWVNKTDLFLFQEAVDRRAFLDVIQQANLKWNQVEAFRFEGETAGVMNAGSVSSIYNCSIKTAEPALRIPKSILASLYPIADSRFPLLVINVHGVNFEIGMGAYRRQMSQAFALAKSYPGPVILAGDFNSWGEKRAYYIDSLAQASGLQQVIPTPDVRVKVLSEPLDHLFYRGLVLHQSDSRKTSASDHNPLWAEFSIPSAVVAKKTPF